MERRIAIFASEDFPWEQIDSDDFICEIDDYVLRVEQMGKGHWWWRVSYKGEPIPEPTNEYCKSKFKAIIRCEGLYLEHSKFS